MCLPRATYVLARLRPAAIAALESLDCDTSAAAAGTAATKLSAMLRDESPLVNPLPDPLPGQVTPEQLLKYQADAYPALLAEVVGPPLRLGRADDVGYVAAECSLAALRSGRLQPALTMLFLSTLCTPEMDQAAAEALHHLLQETDAHGSIGLLAGGMRQSGIEGSDPSGLRQRLDTFFLTTAVQLLGTWGRSGPRPSYVVPG